MGVTDSSFHKSGLCPLTMHEFNMSVKGIDICAAKCVMPLAGTSPGIVDGFVVICSNVLLTFNCDMSWIDCFGNYGTVISLSVNSSYLLLILDKLSAIRSAWSASV